MSRLPMWFKGLTPELMRKAETELNETPHVKAKSMVELRRLINEQTDMYSRLDDSFLLRFLRTKKYNVQKALKVLRNYYMFNDKHARLFTKVKPSELRNIIEMNVIMHLPYRVPEGSHICVIRLGSYNPRLATGEELTASFFTLAEMTLECEASQICGGIIIFDLFGAGLQQYKMFVTFAFAKFIIYALQECWPERLKGIHFVNEPYVMHAIYKMTKLVGKKKLLERVHFHGSNVKELQDFIPQDLLPQELGGDAGPMDNKEFASYFFSQEEFIERISKYGMLEKKK